MTMTITSTTDDVTDDVMGRGVVGDVMLSGTFT